MAVNCGRNLEPESSGEAGDAPASSATCESIGYKGFETPLRDTWSNIRGHVPVLDGDLMAKTRG